MAAHHIKPEKVQVISKIILLNSKIYGLIIFIFFIQYGMNTVYSFKSVLEALN